MVRNSVITAVAGLSIIAAGCHRETVTTGAVYSCGEISLFPDSVTVGGKRVDIITADSVTPGRGGTFRSGLPVFDRLFDVSDTLSLTTPGAIFLYDAIANPDRALRSLRELVDNNGHIIVSDSLLPRPVLSGCPEWTVAAWELYKSTGNRRWLESATEIALRSLDTDRDYAYNNAAGLFRGVPESLSRPYAFPPEMGPIALYETMNLRSNVMYVAAFRALGEMLPAGEGIRDFYSAFSDTLARTVNRSMWIPNLGVYSRCLYGGLYPIAAESTDNYGQALAVIHNVSSLPMCRSLIENTPVLPDRVPTLSPAPEGYRQRYSALTQAAWTIAATSAANNRATASALTALAAAELQKPAAERDAAAIRGVLYRGLLGMELTTDGISFAPFIPDIMPGDKTLTGLQYRNAVIDLTVHGTGDIISTFAIDGKPAAEYVFPASLEGHHSVTITLSGQSSAADRITLADNVATLPPVPRIKAGDNHSYTITNSTPGEKYMTYVNGMMEELIPTSTYDLYDARRVTFVAFAPVIDNRYVGFANNPQVYIPRGKEITVAAKDITRPGTRLIKDKEISSRFVQSTRWKNHRIAFHVEVPDSGRYIVSVSYLNGLGIVNPTRKCAVRQLSVNGSDAGLLIFPQRPPRDWSHKSDWRQLTSTTNRVAVTLRRGVNRLSIDYIDLPFHDFNTETNIILIDKITILNNNP